MLSLAGRPDHPPQAGGQRVAQGVGLAQDEGEQLEGHAGDISSKHHIIILIIIQALATDEAETICKLEKRNFELVELQKKLESKMEVEREKLKRALDNAKKEGELLKILVNELHREIEGKDDQIKEITTQLAEAKDDVLKLEEANSRLKGQVLVCANKFSCLLSWLQ